MNVLTPISERHLLEGARALADAPIIVAKNLDSPLGQVSGPKYPWDVGIMTLGCQWPHKQCTSSWPVYPVQYGVQVCAGDLKISSSLRRPVARLVRNTIDHT